MKPITIRALEDFPAQLEAHYAAIPNEFKHWAPVSWEGVPQACRLNNFAERPCSKATVPCRCRV